MTGPRVLDRLDGQRRQAGDDAPLLEGRWLLEQSVRQNGHTEFLVGDLLLHDGTAGLRLGTTEAVFRRPRLSDADSSDYQLALDAIAAIDDRTNLVKGELPSPLLPAELGEQSKPTQLDELLDEVFERGHLDAIATRPRLSMRYETELLPVDRARRLDTSFQRHLAAHSECWTARTLSGVVPKTVLARVSEDDPDIYEHRVYARLLDHLERYLRGRIVKLSGIAARYQQGLEFNNSEDVDWRLRRDICGVWGEAVSTGEADKLLGRNREQLAHLERWLKRIRALKGRRIKGFDGGSLYLAIPRGAQVGLSLVPTNLLQHDAHYRQLRQLWAAWLSATAAERERPVQVLARRRADEDRYERYIGLLLARALQSMRLQVEWLSAVSARAICNRWDDAVSLENRGHTWRIGMNGHRLVLVPSAAAVDADTAAEWATRTLDEGREVRVPCFLHTPECMVSLPPPEHLVAGHPALRLSPLDLYAEEKVHALVAAWLWQRRLAGHGEVFQRLPTAVAAAWPETVLDQRNGHTLCRPVSDTAWQCLREALEQHALPQLRDQIANRRMQLDRLAQCPECSCTDATFEPLPSGFFARCDCGCRWELRDGNFRLTRVNGESQNFATLGHRWLQVPVKSE
ncbi:hypothetical protein Thimo_0909 [Thioflavicoccus mobilis 8321]|uniref:DUF2357 domain-containing protein n=1 Tax=Thioflavicoccus mobilis 8321 TaxID=765912 RepID=L0GWJ4_9GAMM|nr:hypothetical protein [Thioflavicoccus mobilis]AGA89740.1 hypothetical protein Thimo_0909 [Thioflavicoccus mobilis 8321]